MTTDHLKGLERLQAGNLEIDKALGLTLPEAAVEKHARAALLTLRSAMDFLEDTMHFEAAHTALHDAGRRINERFGCHLHHEPGYGYTVECPVALAHPRVGFSADVIHAGLLCSICGAEADDCDHVSGVTYDGAECSYLSTDPKLIGVHIVSRPEKLITRFSSFTKPYQDFAHLPHFARGLPVRCDFCQEDCEGVTEVPLDGHGAMDHQKDLDGSGKGDAGRFTALLWVDEGE